MEGFIVHKFDLATKYSGEYINLEGYKYLSIYTDGAVNPEANVNVNNELLLYLQFSNIAEKYGIEAEVQNIPIRDHKWAKFYNEALSGCVSCEVSNGYGTLYIVLSKYPYTIPKIQHEDPFFCLDITVPASTTVYYWVGKNRPDVSYPLLIPYMPLGYRQLFYMVYSNATTFQVTVNPYFPCADTMLTAFTLSTNSLASNANVCAWNRYRIGIQNGDGAERVFRVAMAWAGKGV